jgi:hypothetical protein
VDTNWYDKIEPDNFASQTTDLPDTTIPQTSVANAISYKGAAIGLAAGVLVSLIFKKNIWLFGTLGVAAGGLGTPLIKQKIKKK